MESSEYFSECQSSQDANGFSSSMKNMKDILQLNYLEVTGVGNIKPHFKCFRRSNPDSQFLYLGKHKGDYYVHKKFLLKNPLVWLNNDNGIFSIYVMAGFYPCSDRSKDIANVVVEIVPSTYKTTPKTLMKTAQDSDVDFYPAWPHTYLTDHGEWKGSAYLLQLESQMTVSKSSKYILINFDKDIFQGYIQDQKMTLKLSPTSKPIEFLGLFDIKNNKWIGAMELLSYHNWKQFFLDFFPIKVPFHPTIYIVPDFKTKLVETIDSIEVGLNLI